MKYNDYIQNPMGIKNAVFSGREMYRLSYTKKWDELKVRENGIIKYLLMTSKTDYYVYIKIPSEVIPKFYYDVVIRFFTKSPSIGVERNLENYDVQFYSNDPSYVFTFAHAFSKNNLFITDLSPKMSKFALKHKADERNPKDDVGYVKSLYFAYLYIKSKGLMEKAHYNSNNKVNYDKGYLLSLIEDADTKIENRQKAGNEISKKKRRENVNKPNQRNTQSNSQKEPERPFGNNAMIAPKSKIGSKSKISGKSKITGSLSNKGGKR